MNKLKVCGKILKRNLWGDNLARGKSNINRNIASIVGKKQQELQLSVHNNWWYGDTKTSFAIKVMREIGFYITLVVNFIIVSGYRYRYSRLPNATYAANDRSVLSNAITAFSIGTILLIVGYVMQKLSKEKEFGKPYGKVMASFILTTLGSLQLGVTAISVLITNHMKYMYATAVNEAVSDIVYFKLFGFHIIPLLMLIISAVLFFIGTRCDRKEKTYLYKKLTDNLYGEFTKENPNYSQNDWEDYLDNYKSEE